MAPTRHGPRAPLPTVVCAVLALLVAGAVGATSAAAAPRPEVIALPDGFSPEGVATGGGNTVYVGSLRDGDIWWGDLRTGEGTVLVDAPAGRTAVGIKVDPARKLIVVAGGATGEAFFYDSRTGEDLGAVTLTTNGDTLVNDVTLTRDGAWFTDSRQPVLYFVPLQRDGSFGPAEPLPLSGPAADVSGAFNLNGIAATQNGSALVVGHSERGALILVDPADGTSRTIDLRGEPVPIPDGILLDGRRLWVVQPFLDQIAEVRLTPDLTSGEIVSVRTDDDFRFPSTVALHGDSLVAVNARFDVGIPGPTDAEYELVIVDR